MEQLRDRACKAGDLNLVLVEDDAAYAEIYKFRLERDGYQVALAADGRSGLELIRETRPNLVYLDIRLPEMDGLEVLHSLRADPTTAHLLVVVLSNYDEPQLRDEGFQLGVLEWLVKADVTPAALARRTASWLRIEGQAEPAEDASSPGG
jgi:two-component system alkaline phosphatase synthesis response regulator PhoP